MNINIILNNEKFTAGVTFKDENEPEKGNMALHTCENPEDVIKNREKLSEFLHCQLHDFVFPNQTHSANFYKVTASDKGRGTKSTEDAIMDTDALYTYEPNIVLSCFTADCVPVLFYNEAKGLIGVIHSGWQGTVKEITIKLFEHLKEVEGCDPKDFRVYMGPCISQEKFEVDEDVYSKFMNLGYAENFIYFNEKTNKYHIDNRQTVKRQCERVGIPPEQIKSDETCTFVNPSGFSYRENKKSGRHLSFILRKE